MSIVGMEIDPQDAEALIDQYGREAAGEALLRAIERHLARDARTAGYWIEVAQDVTANLATCHVQAATAH